MVNNILKKPTINNKELLINDILNETECKAFLTNCNNEISNKKETECKAFSTNNDEISNNNKTECKAFLTNKESECKAFSISNKKESTNTVKTPEFLKSKRAILNPQSYIILPNIFFDFIPNLITLSLHHKDIGKNPCRTPNFKPYINNFNR